MDAAQRLTYGSCRMRHSSWEQRMSCKVRCRCKAGLLFAALELSFLIVLFSLKTIVQS
jgi:hypothetical protein